MMKLKNYGKIMAFICKCSIKCSGFYRSFYLSNKTQIIINSEVQEDVQLPLLLRLL